MGRSDRPHFPSFIYSYSAVSSVPTQWTAFWLQSIDSYYATWLHNTQQDTDILSWDVSLGNEDEMVCPLWLSGHTRTHTDHTRVPTEGDNECERCAKATAGCPATELLHFFTLSCYFVPPYNGAFIRGRTSQGADIRVHLKLETKSRSRRHTWS